MDKSRRNTLKRLGVTGVAAWAVPTVTALVVPQHASATSSGAQVLSISSKIQYYIFGGTDNVLQVSLTSEDFALINASASSVVTAYGENLSNYVFNDGLDKHFFFVAGILSAPFENGETGNVTIDEVDYALVTEVIVAPP